MGNESKTPEHIWAWWDNDYDVGMVNTHGDKRYTPTEAREYVLADRIEELEAKLEEAVKVAENSIKWLRLYGADVHREATTLAELKGAK